MSERTGAEIMAQVREAFALLERAGGEDAASVWFGGDLPLLDGCVLLTAEEAMLAHHALRVLLTHPLPLGEDEHRAVTALADSLWEEHAQRVAMEQP